jgi:hypothetical protein
MHKVQQKLGRVFILCYGREHAMQLPSYDIKLPKQKMKTQRKQLYDNDFRIDY